MKKLLSVLIIILITTPLLSADDLYKVTLNSKLDISQLELIGAEPIVKLNKGYLVLLKKPSVDEFKSTGFEYEMIKENILNFEIV